MSRSAWKRFDGAWLSEPVETSGAADPVLSAEQQDSIRFAFLVMLERLTPIERAVVLLRDVFGYQYGEIAEVVGAGETNCRQILHRDRAHVAEGKPRFAPSHHESRGS